MVNKKIIGYYLLIPVLAVMMTACTREEAVYLDSSLSAQQTTETIMPVKTEEPAFCYVYVCGAVNQPGVYQLAEGARVSEAIELAGGFTEDAVRESYNLAEKVADAQKIQILSVTEAENQQLDGTVEVSDGRINLNTATAAELMTLPGVGQAKADSIISYREEHGGFDKIEDVKNVSGIKEGIFVKMKDSITVN